jgi:hypothetical protein
MTDTKRLMLLIIVLLLPSRLLADPVTLPNQLRNNTPADAEQVQANFETLKDKSNENDERITALESRTSLIEQNNLPGKPVWIDSGGRVLGTVAMGDISTGKDVWVYIRTNQSNEMYGAQYRPVNGDCYSVNRIRLYWSAQSCTGTPVINRSFDSSDSAGIQIAPGGPSGNLYAITETPYAGSLRSYSEIQ